MRFKSRMMTGFLLVTMIALSGSAEAQAMAKNKIECKNVEPLPYGRQTPPAFPEPFGPWVFSSAYSRYGLHLHSSLYVAPDGSELFFTHQDRPVKRFRSTTILQMTRTKSGWTAPVAAPFASDYSDQTGWFSPGGKRFYFGSVRPVKPDAGPVDYLRMWITDKTDEGWSPPRYVPEFHELTVDHGPLYIPIAGPGGIGQQDVYRLSFHAGFYGDPVNVGKPVNSAAEDYPVLTGPDERYLIIYRTDRFDRGISGLYLTFRTENGWTDPQRIPGLMGNGFDASLSPDGSALFFLIRNDGIYWVDSKIIEVQHLNRSEASKTLDE